MSLVLSGPSIVATHARAAILTEDGELLTLSSGDAARMLKDASPALLVHAPATFRRLGMRVAPALDLLELFAFVMPARLATPTPLGLALALDIDAPETLEDAAALLPTLADALLNRLHAGRDLPIHAHAAGIAARMSAAGWPWAQAVARALGSVSSSPDAMRVWRRVPEWEEAAPVPPPSSHPVTPAEARARLSRMLGPAAEQRPGQADYADAVSSTFLPREERGDPHVVLAEAGTGTGKTLGYIAPASVWAERNRGSVWISTFTKLLQRQIESEFSRLYPDPAERRRHVVLRKGRENYLCLLNLEDQLRPLVAAAPVTIQLGLIVRWAEATSSGDLMGGDLPGWFPEMFGPGLAASLADRRGECIHGACPHYRRCFVEHTIRRARTAEIVVANHALVMTQAAWGGLDDDTVPTRYVFDEGHHVFGAADSAFASELSGAEGAEMRRWMLGAEGGTSRARGLRRRLDELVVGKPALEAPLDALLLAASALPAAGWSMRLAGAELPGMAELRVNPFETFLQAARRQILARLPGDEEPGPRLTLECEMFPPNRDVAEAAPALARALQRIEGPVRTLLQRLETWIEEDADELDQATRSRIEAACRGLQRRALDPLRIWQAMLRALAEPRPDPGERPAHVYFLRLDRRDNTDRDIAFCRHHLDPTQPFAITLVAPAHGLLVTSATLRDGGGANAEAEWEAAEARVGATHLPSPALRASVGSPFDYARQTRAFVISDLGSDTGQLAGAYRALFEASGGGALGLFTAIQRLRAVHGRIAPALEEAGIPLYAQHVDAMDNNTLVDIFRSEENACLLGTDAMRDGLDVPGRSLRLVVFERVPWPRPDILHKERRIHLSGGDPSGYDDRIARLRLRQAFGRLIRTATDRGVFVLLDRRTPTRLLSALPEGVEVRRVGLAEAVAETVGFLSE